MALAPGSRLGPYEILAPLGAGGMGEVYRARDTRLGREVAVKVLPESLASDPERLRRFEKEARSASALNHPNIVTIYDIGSSDSVSWIAMERVDGKTLRELLSFGQLEIKKLLLLGAQIAEGLAKAHEAGIVHRDLKPENVMVTKDGLVKILDFGLAKLTSTVSESGEGSQLPTMTGTTPGVIVGTVGYMSPEQASGEGVDFRSDQFSFGSMLYEMATGKKAFQKRTAVDTLSAILHEEPRPVGEINPEAPAPLRWIVERCLAKEPRGRYASTEDLARDLAGVRDHLSEAISGGSLAARPAASVIRRRFALPVLSVIAAAVLLILGAVLGGWWGASRANRAQAPSFHRLTFGRGNVLNARFTPDGKTVAYGAAWEGAPAEIFTVRTDSIESRPIGLSRADVMSVSSKGELAVLIHKTNVLEPIGTGTLARVPIGGGTPRELLENVVRADWAPNGEDLAVLVRLPSRKTQLQYPIGNVLAESADLNALQGVRVSPGGELVVLAEWSNGREQLTVVPIDRKKKRNVVFQGSVRGYYAWSPHGDEIILTGSHSGDDWAMRAVSLSGRERVLIPGDALLVHDIAPDGRLLAERSVDRDGIACLPRGENREREIGQLASLSLTDISDDGSLVLFKGGEPGNTTRILLQKTDGTPSVHLGDGHPLGLSADGRWVLALLNGPPRELVMMPTGPGASKKIPVEGIEPVSAWLLPAGKGFLVRAPDKNGDAVLVVVGPDGGRPSPVPTDGYLNQGTVISPEGDRFAYVTKGGQLRIAPLSGGDAKPLPGAPLDSMDVLARWSVDGRFLYLWRFGDIPVRVDRLELATGRRELWKTLAPADSAGVTQIGPVVITPDGRSYAYGSARVLVSDLYVVAGLR